MRCHEAKGLLGLFLDGKLEEVQSIKLKAHLDKCPTCSEELNLLRESWNLLGEWKSITPSPNFKSTFWQRVSQEETVAERKPIFVFPRLDVRFAPAVATIAVILIIGILLANFASVGNLQQLALITKDEDILMLKELDLTEDLEIIQNLHVLEDLEAIDSIQL